MVYHDPEIGKQPLVVSYVVCGHLPGKVHLDYVLEVLSGGCDEQYAGTNTLERDTSPSYLLFQTLLPLFWTLTCMI